MDDIPEAHRDERRPRRTPGHAGCGAVRHQDGFTLVEALVAMVLLSVGLLAVMAISASAPRMVVQAGKRTERAAEAAAHLERSVLELRRTGVQGDSSWTLPGGDQVTRTVTRSLDQRLWTVTLQLVPAGADPASQALALTSNVFIPAPVAELDPCRPGAPEPCPQPGTCPAQGPLAGINLGGLAEHLFFFTDGSSDANWHGGVGYAGDAAVHGIRAKERSGSFAYAGTIFTNDATLSGWGGILTRSSNLAQASADLGATARVQQLETSLHDAFAQINALPVTPGFESRSSTSLDGLNTQNGVAQRIVINVTSEHQVSTRINIRGDASDVFVLRWDTDANPANGYQGQVKFQSGGAIVPLGGLTPGNFIHVAGDLNAAGGGVNPPPPYPQGPRVNSGLGALVNGGSDWNGGGFFTGYWLTTGTPNNRETAPFSNVRFVGGWYSSTTKFTVSGGGVHVCPNPQAIRW
jgi:prepilin-type N-terminal cleavage/methylation domain-containing protein